MNRSDLHQDDAPTLSREDLMSALFANLVIQQTNLALTFLGKVPRPESGETIHDLESANMLIDQLEMLEVKTKGNLNKQEESLLKQSLTALRLAFVQAVEHQTQEPASATPSKTAASAPAQSRSGSPPEPGASSPASSQPAEEESHKKFTKRY